MSQHQQVQPQLTRWPACLIPSAAARCAWCAGRAGAVMAAPDLTNPVDYALALEQEKAVRRIRREAEKAVAMEDRGPVIIPAFETLRARLARPRQETQWRIHGWQPQGSRVICAAQFKAGKTTLRRQRRPRLVDGDPFLGRDLVMPVSGTVAVIDLEMGESQLDDWLRDQGIRHDRPRDS